MLLGGRYQLSNAPISTGSYGSVFIAEDQRMPRRVAVKILHPQHATNPTVRTRFLRELEAACRVSHENVVSVHDLGEDPQLGLYYVMELVRGTSLHDHMRGAPMPWSFVYRVGLQIARALHAIHGADIVHRDLKPQNIMLLERSSLEELVKVLDFGIASLKNLEDDERDIELTGARMVLGTPPYMSPEQTYMKSDRERLGLEIDARSDIYSLGVILYELASGRRPFGGDAHDIVVAHRLTPPKPLIEMGHVNVPREFAELVMSCLEKDPQDRPQTAKELIGLIKACEFLPTRPSREVMAHDVAPSLPTDPATGPASRPSTRSGLVAPLFTLALGATLAALVFLLVGPVGARDPGEVVAKAVATPPSALSADRVTPAIAPPSPVVEAPIGAAATAPPEVAPSLLGPGDATARGLAEPDAPAPSPRVGLLVTSQPPGATLIAEGREAGVTPTTLSFEILEKRDVQLTLRKPLFVDRPVVLSIGPELAGQTVVVSETLEKKKAPLRATPATDPFRDL
jgi:hypothetical protein